MKNATLKWETKSRQWIYKENESIRMIICKERIEVPTKLKMVVATGAAVATVITGGTAAAAGAALGSMAGATGAGAGTGVAVGTAAGVGTAGGAIAGATATGSAAGAAIGTVAGGTAAAGVGSSGLGLGAFVAGTGGWGLLAIGTAINSEDKRITYDCWKPVVHDTSSEPSNGMLLKDLVCHPHVSKVSMTEGTWPELPNIVLENAWNERFAIEYLLLHDSGKIVGHAQPLCE